MSIMKIKIPGKSRNFKWLGPQWVACQKVKGLCPNWADCM